MVPGMYDLALPAGWEPYVPCMVHVMLPELDLYYTDFARHLTMTG